MENNIGALPMPPLSTNAKVSKPNTVVSTQETIEKPIAVSSVEDNPNPSLSDKIIDGISQNDFTNSIIAVAKDNTTENVQQLIRSTGDMLFAPKTSTESSPVLKNISSTKDYVQTSWKVDAPESISKYKEIKQQYKQEVKDLKKDYADAKKVLTATEKNLKQLEKTAPELEYNTDALKAAGAEIDLTYMGIKGAIEKKTVGSYKETVKLIDKDIKKQKANFKDKINTNELSIKVLQAQQKENKDIDYSGQIQALKDKNKELKKQEKETIRALKQDKRDANPVPGIDKFNYGMDILTNSLKKLVGDGQLRLGDEYHQDIAKEAGISDIANLFGLSGDGHDPTKASKEQIQEAWKQLGENELKQFTKFSVNFTTDLTKSLINNLTFGLLSGKKKTLTPQEFLAQQAPSQKNIPDPEPLKSQKSQLESFTMQGQPPRSFFSFGADLGLAQQIALGNRAPSTKDETTAKKDEHETGDITATFFKVLTTEVKYIQPYQFVLVEKRLDNGTGVWKRKDYRIESFEVPFVTGDSTEVNYGALNTAIKNNWNTSKYYCNIHVLADYRLQNFLTFCKQSGVGVQRTLSEIQEQTEGGGTFSIQLQLNTKSWKIVPTNTSKKIDFNISTLGEDTNPTIKTSYVLKILSDRDLTEEQWMQTFKPENMGLVKSGWIPFHEKYNTEYKNKETYIGFDNFRIINVEPDRFELKSSPDNSKSVYGFIITISWTSMYFIDPWIVNDDLDFKKFNYYDVNRSLFNSI